MSYTYLRSLTSCSTMKAFSSSFYLPSRMGAIYPRLSLKEALPSFKSLEEWQAKKSTKVDICARMCLHLLSRDDAAPMIFREGTVIFPETPQPAPGKVISQDTKILIYQEFPSFGPLIRTVRKAFYRSVLIYSTLLTGLQTLQDPTLAHRRSYEI